MDQPIDTGRQRRHTPAGPPPDPSSRAAAAFVPSAQQRGVIDHDRGRLKVLAGPGTGKTTTLVESVADRVERRRIDPAAILVLTFSRLAAAELTARLSRRLQVTTVEPLVRTLHSFAYSITRRAAARAGRPAPRLLEAGQADLMVRDILQGHALAGGAYWPAGLHAALGVPSFAAELREMMLRCAERGITPRRLSALARRHRRPEWTAVARFIDEYRDISDLRQGTTGLGSKLDQAELTAAAIECLDDAAMLAAERSRARRIFVDEYQDVDPAQAALVEMIADGADELVVVGDPDQAIYAFRGAQEGAMARLEADAVVDLTVSRRLPPTLIEATRRVAARIPGPRSHRALVPAATEPAGELEVRTLATQAQEAAFVADQLRRAHLHDAVPYSSMAVLMRAPATDGELYRRALTAVGIPVASGTTTPLPEQPAVAALLGVLRYGLDPEALDGEAAMSLLVSPLGGMDVLSVRRLRRAINAGTRVGPAASPGDGERSTTVLARVLAGAATLPPGVPADLAAPVDRLAGMISVAAAGRAEPAALDVLWAVWERSGLADRWERLAGARGDGARLAGRHLDAVTTLFHRAEDLAAQLPAAGVGGLLEVVGGEQVMAGARPDPADRGVRILSAHAAKGLEWDIVAVVDVAEGQWPDLRRRSGLLDFDALAGAADGLDSLPPSGALVEERRLFYVAVTRPRRRLVVTAVDGPESTPSRFVAELTGGEQPASGPPRGRSGAPLRSLNLPALVADLRSALAGDVGDGDTRDDARRRRAARVLAFLARAQVRGADPRHWYGLAGLSTDRPLAPVGDAVVMSPSQVESAVECPLRTALVRHGGQTSSGTAQLVGTAVHALAEGMAAGASTADMDAAIDRFIAGQDSLPPWEANRQRKRMIAMRQALQQWWQAASDGRDFLGSEIAVDVTVDGDRPVRLRGRIDWLTRDSSGRVVITDFKTGTVTPTAAQAAVHPQLAVYQLAVRLGALSDAVAADPGGGELVYLASGTPKIRSQEPQSADESAAWAKRLTALGEESVGPRFEARIGEYCRRCPVRSSCPLQPEGRSVIR